MEKNKILYINTTILSSILKNLKTIKYLLNQKMFGKILMKFQKKKIELSQ
jgi:hypothetical protein